MLDVLKKVTGSTNEWLYKEFYKGVLILLGQQRVIKLLGQYKSGQITRSV
jgi:hypothetical protein